MRFLPLAIAAVAAGIGRPGAEAFELTGHRLSSRVISLLRSSSLSHEQELQQQQQQREHHPHRKLWSNTLENSPNSHVHPSVELVVRPPSEGGTGIVAVDDVPAGTVAMCLPLEEVGMIDAASILDSYDDEGEQERDEVMSMLKEMWIKELVAAKNQQNSEEGKRLAVLAGIIAHLQLTRFKDKTSWTTASVKEGCALQQSRRLGMFLDAMPLLPQHDANVDSNDERHPFPTHYLYWDDDEVEILLRGTMGQTKAREVRAGIGLVVREWSSSFLKEHSSGASQAQILNAIFSAFTAVLSRSFGDEAGRDLEGKGRMLVPLVDMLNHDGEDPNVSWTWHVGEGDEEKIAEGRGEIAVTTLRDMRGGEELLKCYGWRPAWDIASSYGFVPALGKERWECAVVPLFPSVLDLVPDAIPTPSQKSMDETTVDLTLETNYGPLVNAVIAAADAACQVKALKESLAAEDEPEGVMGGADDDRPPQLNRLEIVSLFRPPPKSTADEFPFARRQPCVVLGTKISSGTDTEDRQSHRRAIESILPAFRAAAVAISQLRNNHQNPTNGSSVPIKASEMAVAAASPDGTTEWDRHALQLIHEGIQERMQTLVDDGKAAEAWLMKHNEADGLKHREYRAGVARDVRNAELDVLHALHTTTTDW